MLNIPLIQQAMQQHGLNQAELASRCDVSREAVSRWLAGESIPRPLRLKHIAECLHLDIPSLLITAPAPVVQTNPAVGARVFSREARESMLDSSWRVRELAQFVAAPCFSPRRLRNPSTDGAYLRTAVCAMKAEVSTSPAGFLLLSDLVDLNIAAGTGLLPCPWQGDRAGQAQPFVVEPSADDETWVVFGLNTSRSALRGILAYALGLQYCRGTLEGAEAQEFARKFAAALAVDAPATLPNEDAETVAEMYFEGTLEVPPPKFITLCEKVFATPAYRAIGALQRYEGGRDPAFIASLLSVSLGEAVAWSYVLWGHANAAEQEGAVQALV
jgi:transcriptional regulator with XRE-family HTH domain